MLYRCQTCIHSLPWYVCLWVYLFPCHLAHSPHLGSTILQFPYTVHTHTQPCTGEHTWSQYVCNIPYGRFSSLTALIKSLDRETHGSKLPPSYDGLTPSVALAMRTPLPLGHTSSRRPWHTRGERNSVSDSHLARQWAKQHLSIVFQIFYKHTISVCVCVCEV